MSKRYVIGQTKEAWGKMGIFKDGVLLKLDEITELLEGSVATVAALESELRRKEVALLEAKIESALNARTASSLAMCDFVARLVVAQAACEGDEPDK